MGARRRSHRAVAWLLAGLVTLAAACSDDDATGDGTDPTATTTAATAATATTEPTPAAGSLFPVGDVDPGLQPWIEDATGDLAARLGVEAAEVTVVSGVLVVWPDTALGCPEPDTAYATVLTDGAVIELAADRHVYRYHAGGERTPFLCSTPIITAPTRL